MLHQFGSNVIPLEARLSVAFSAAIVLPALNLVTMTIPNAAVLLFPGWFQTGKEGPQGIEATGQRLFLALGQFFVFIVALVPAAIVPTFARIPSALLHSLYGARSFPHIIL